ncbi:lytic transglycosylase domain-containing protein [Alkalicoccus chagannorensis]|uniref:lytic transglycosylase domain-containing protein n=1 Tax=Alkalicoccus chagannorensis TaxID=427072 RepID=UPI00054F0C76|nr:lytic transglycosylase domain-containing protein [Alkalicoccus chagannorensis]
MKQPGVKGAGIFLAAAVFFFVLLWGVSSIYEQTQEESEEPEPQIASYEIPASFIPVYQEAEEEYGVPWRLLAAVHRIETVFSTMDTLVSPVGAEGHLQFMPCTWAGWNHPSCEGLGEGDISESELTDPDVIAQYGGYGVDADGNGQADPYSLEDAVFSAANYLADAGAADGRLEDAVYDYNRADWYVDDVLEFYEIYEAGYETVELEEQDMEYVVE